MSVMYIRDKDGNLVPVKTIRGEPGKNYVLTDADMAEIAGMVDGGISVTGASVGQTVKISAVDENGVPTAWEPVDSQSDWNQNDETQPDYIKNRPFYDGVKTAVLCEAEASSFSTDVINDENHKNPIYETDCVFQPAEFVYGEEYIIDINGQTYTMPLSSQMMQMMGDYNVGFNLASDVNSMNSSHYKSEYPFCLFFYAGYELPVNGKKYTGMLRCFLPNSTQLPVNVKVYQEKEVFRQIDPKYIPDSIGGGVFIIDKTADDYSVTDSTYGNTVKNALLDGKTVYYYDGTGYFSIGAFSIKESTTGEVTLNVYTGYSTSNGSIGPFIKSYTFAITL